MKMKKRTAKGKTKRATKPKTKLKIKSKTKAKVNLKRAPHRLSFEQAIEQRTAKDPKGARRPPISHDTTAHDVAVEDGSPLPMVRYTDVGGQPSPGA